MPSDLQIEPSVVNIGGAVPKLPTNPAGAAVEASTEEAQKTTRQALVLYGAVKRQQEIQTNADAMVHYKDRLNKLDEATASITDIDKRRQAMTTGLNDTLEDLKKTYPTLSPTALKTIQLEMSNDFHNFTLKAIADAHKQGRDNMENTYKNLVKLVGQSSNDNEKKTLTNQMYQVLDGGHQAGWLSEGEANAKKTQFLYDVHKESFNHLVDVDPTRALMVHSPEAAHLTSEDWYAAHQRAQSEITFKNGAAARDWKQKRDQAYWQSTPQNAVQLYDRGMISAERVKELTGNPPQNVGLQNHFINAIKGAGSVEELDNLMENEVKRHTLHQADASPINFAYHHERELLSTTHGKNQKDLLANLHNNIAHADPLYNMPSIEGFAGNKTFNTTTLRSAGRELDDAKSTKEQHEIYDKYNKAVMERYKKGGTTPAAVPNTLPGTATTEDKDKEFSENP